MASDSKSLIPQNQIILLMIFVLIGCGGFFIYTKKPQETPTPSADTKDALFLVNGSPITRNAVDLFAKDTAQRNNGTPPSTDALNSEVIDRELLLQELQSPEILADRDFSAKAENIKRTILSQLVLDHFLSSHPPVADELLKEYGLQIQGINGTEYRVRHILLTTQDAAKDIIARIGKGEKFDVLARRYSLDSASKASGGELGWSDLEEMSKPLSDAVRGLKAGEISPIPIHTFLGWHIVELEESRSIPPPSFESLRERLIQIVQAKKIQQHLTDLKKSAKIETLAPAP